MKAAIIYQIYVLIHEFLEAAAIIARPLPLGGKKPDKAPKTGVNMHAMSANQDILINTFCFLSIGSKHICLSVNSSDSLVPRPRIPKVHKLS